MNRQSRNCTCTISIISLIVSHVLCATGQPAFPGAEGFGGRAKGGAGGRTIWVTNLDSKGPGSLRDAIDTILRDEFGENIDNRS